MEWDDLPLLLDWLCQPHVVEWWRREPEDLAAVEAKYGPCITGVDRTELFVVEVDEQPVGMIQRYLLDDEPEWRAIVGAILDPADAAGIDYLIGDPAATGRGVGTVAIRTMTKKIWAWRPVRQIIVTVQQANIASWRALEKAGFSRMWAGELDSDDPSDAGPEYAYVVRRLPALPML